MSRFPMAGHLAQTPSTSSGAALFIWSLILIGVLIALFLAVSLLKKWIVRQEPAPPAGFTLADLRQLHRSGQMSAEEFDRAKARLLAATKFTPKPPPQRDLPPDPR